MLVINRYNTTIYLIFIVQFTSKFLKNLLLNHMAVTIYAAWSDYFEKKIRHCIKIRNNLLL